MLIALISLDQQWLDKKENMARCAALVGEAQIHGCELVIFSRNDIDGLLTRYEGCG